MKRFTSLIVITLLALVIGTGYEVLRNDSIEKIPASDPNLKLKYDGNSVLHALA